jgi:hypothetical protein
VRRICERGLRAALAGDLLYALRRFGRSPGFTAIAVISLALGIGANTALFSIVNAALLRLIPVEHPNELSWFAVEQSGSTPQLKYLSYPFYEHLKGDKRFSGLLCAFPASVNVRGSAVTECVDIELVSGSYFSTLGLNPRLGRLISPDDDRIRLGYPVVVLSHAYWQARMGADRGVIGRSLELNGAPHTIVWVAPPGFGRIQHGFRVRYSSPSI